MGLLVQGRFRRRPYRERLLPSLGTAPHSRSAPPRPGPLAAPCVYSRTLCKLRAGWMNRLCRGGALRPGCGSCRQWRGFGLSPGLGPEWVWPTGAVQRHFSAAGSLAGGAKMQRANRRNATHSPTGGVDSAAAASGDARLHPLAPPGPCRTGQTTARGRPVPGAALKNRIINQTDVRCGGKLSLFMGDEAQCLLYRYPLLSR